MVIILSYCLLYEENELQIQHEKLQKCGIATPKNQCHIFNTLFSIPHFQCHIFNTLFSIPHFQYLIFNTTCYSSKIRHFHEKNRQNEEHSFAEFSF